MITILLLYLLGIFIGWFVTQRIYVAYQNRQYSFWATQLGQSSFVRGDLPLGGIFVISIGLLLNQIWLIVLGIGLALGVLACVMFRVISRA